MRNYMSIFFCFSKFISTCYRFMSTPYDEIKLNAVYLPTGSWSPEEGHGVVFFFQRLALFLRHSNKLILCRRSSGNIESFINYVPYISIIAGSSLHRTDSAFALVLPSLTAAESCTTLLRTFFTPNTIPVI